jgi:DNA-directed RNA polymerase subunit RPC12/RpoP
MSSEDVRVLRLVEPQGEPDVIECDSRLYVPDRECEYVPAVFDTEWDEHDRELTIGRPSNECDAFICSECSNELMFDWGGDYSWFEPKYPYKPRGLRYCPGCGARVLFPPSWIGKKEVE